MLYDNAAYKKNPSKAEAAVEECIKKAEARGLENDRLGEAAKNAGKSGVASAAAGAAGAGAANAFGHNYDVGASAGASAASGFAGTFALGMMDNDADPGVQGYVTLCLKEKGYSIAAWK